MAITLPIYCVYMVGVLYEQDIYQFNSKKNHPGWLFQERKEKKNQKVRMNEWMNEERSPIQGVK